MPTDSDRCHFTFADGRRCTMPQFPDDMGFATTMARSTANVSKLVKSAATSPISSAPMSLPIATSLPLSALSSPPLHRATSSPKLLLPSPISPRSSPRTSNSPRTNSSSASGATGAKSFATPPLSSLPLTQPHMSLCLTQTVPLNPPPTISPTLLRLQTPPIPESQFQLAKRRRRVTT